MSSKQGNPTPNSAGAKRSRGRSFKAEKRLARRIRAFEMVNDPTGAYRCPGSRKTHS